MASLLASRIASIVRCARPSLHDAAQRFAQRPAVSLTEVTDHNARAPVPSSITVNIHLMSAAQKLFQSFHAPREKLLNFLGTPIRERKAANVHAPLAVVSLELHPVDSPAEQIPLRLQIQHRRNSKFVSQPVDIFHAGRACPKEEPRDDFAEVHGGLSGGGGLGAGGDSKEGFQGWVPRHGVSASGNLACRGTSIILQLVSVRL